MIKQSKAGKGIFNPIDLPPDEKVIVWERESLRLKGIAWLLLFVWSIILGVAWVSLQLSDVPWRSWLLALVDGALLVLLVVMIPIWLYTLLHWWFHVFIVTERRIIHREGILDERRRVLRLDNVVNVNVTKSGLGKWLGVGNLQVKTAGLTGDILMKGVTRPNRIRQIILDTQERLRLQQEHTSMEDISRQLQVALRL